MKDDITRTLSRRHVLKVAAALGAVAPLLMTRPAFAGKVSKATAHYQDHPNGSHDCSECDFFIKPKGDAKFGSCKLVQGNISLDGWCEYYTPEEH